MPTIQNVTDESVRDAWEGREMGRGCPRWLWGCIVSSYRGIQGRAPNEHILSLQESMFDDAAKVGFHESGMWCRDMHRKLENFAKRRKDGWHVWDDNLIFTVTVGNDIMSRFPAQRQ